MKYFQIGQHEITYYMCTKASTTVNLIETPFNNFANRVDPDQAALIRAF